MHKQQPIRKEPLRNTPGFSQTARGASLFLVALLAFFLSNLPLRLSSPPTRNGFELILIGTTVFFLLIIPLTFINIVSLGHGLSTLLRTRRTVGSLMLLLAFLLILFILSPYSYSLFQAINNRDYGLLPFFASIISISLTIEGAILLAQSLAEVLTKRKEERRQKFD